ncbi:glycosyltransferase family 87 protein [Spirilliplanes yamanashiensis]|uniref:Membrane protein n=1 Tax=Spirilliplanes yamanashiensis TaxID=42233 RepID=A0A8J3YBT1_9ACTN|nr:glycosyltransferase family 87 protein [Spirilliplanes yamanashiensis]MDP9816270.1 alpha-1,2-mannosyltransferase [Spirilliplanes yamanashiensis]GIJ05796.1 membrane protein [Spirilliplanes yamanashiensis]
MPASTPRRVAAVAAVTAVCAAALFWYGDRHNYYDLRIYVSAIRWWTDGNPLYDYTQPDRVQGLLYFTYPPLAAVLMWPLAQLPLGAVIAVFTLGTVVAVFVTTWWLIRPAPVPAWFALGVAVPPLFLLEPIRETVTFGQINMLLIVLILADLLIGVPRQARWTGAGIGLATALKLYPGIFILHLLATRRWRAAATAAATAAGVTLLVAAVAPAASWAFWTDALWATERVGRTDYTGNQSLWGTLSRLAAPAEPSRLLWAVLVALVLGYGLWRAARLAAAGDEVAALTVTGVTGALISPITWAHHVWWFVPALVVLVALRRWLAAALLYAVGVFGVVSFVDWGAAVRPDDPLWVQLVRSLYLPALLGLLAFLPARPEAPRNARL